MPTGINEGVEYSEKRLAAEREIAVKYPDAYLSRICGEADVWVSESVDKDLCDIDIVVSSDPKPRPILCFYTTVLGMRVYCREAVPVGSSLYRLKTKEPAAYAELVQTLFRL